ncbi:alpha/beta hydrolase [Piscinibacter sp.]|uniref:alpha/beta hydrolase n=1 Tax=Piscinibacter sp. TaxID=1903157 RepID=UPI002C16871B|nr:alpha/beta hydrolase [Albitalea sp.]HUG22725.1 alpha/beta hydrolase [Albitalea sp.]
MMIPTRRLLLPLIAIVVAACAAPAQTPSTPAATATAAPAGAGTAAAPRMRTLRSDATCPPEFSGTCYPVWFGTNRKPLDLNDVSKGFGAEFDDTMHFGKRIVRIPTSHRPGELGSPLWRRLLLQVDDRITVDPATVLSADAFTRDVRSFIAGLDPADRNVLVYIHGFNTTFDDAARRAAQLGFDLKVPGITMLYSWPSRGRVGAYLSDLSSIEASEEHIANFLVKVTGLAERGKVHLIAHSMGNRGLLRAMHRATTQAALRSGTRFGQIFLSAPDVDAQLFRQLASVYPLVADRTTLYVADQDKALAALEWMTEGGRAGGAPPVLVLPGIDTVRVHGSSLFRLGHSYFAEEPGVLRDIRAQLHWKDPPERRRARYGWPVPDEAPGARGAWVIGR